MKPQTLPIKRRPEPKGFFKRLMAVTGDRKQRVAAAAANEMDFEDGSSKISRALTIIFLIHIVAIGLIFVHQKFLDGRTLGISSSPKTQDARTATAAVSSRLDLPRLAAGEKPYIVRQGDNYANIASTVGVDEGDLRLINKHADIIPGLLLKVPPKRAVVTPTVAMEEMPPVAVTTGVDDLVAVVDESPAPKAKMIKPNVDHSTQPKTSQVAASGKKYVVQNGDSIWRIANRFKVSQEKVMKLNGISDARKIKAGMKLEIPQ